MKAVVYHGIGDIRLDDVPEPRLEEPTDAVQVVALAGVTGAGQREQVPVDRQAGTQLGDRLERLVRGAREDGRLRRACRDDDVTVRVDGNGGAVVHALDEAGPDDPSDHGVAHDRRA